MAVSKNNDVAQQKIHVPPSSVVLVKDESKGNPYLGSKDYDPTKVEVLELIVDAKLKPPNSLGGNIYEFRADHCFQWVGTSGKSWGFSPALGYNGPGGVNEAAPDHFHAWNQDGDFKQGQLVGTARIEGSNWVCDYEDRYDRSKGGTRWYINDFNEIIYLKWYINDSMWPGDYSDNFGKMTFTLIQVHRKHLDL